MDRSVLHPAPCASRTTCSTDMGEAQRLRLLGDDHRAAHRVGVRIAQIDDARLGRRQRGLDALRNEQQLLLGDAGEDVQQERRNVRPELSDQERDALRYQPGNEMNVAAQPVELGNGDMRLPLLAPRGARPRVLADDRARCSPTWHPQAEKQSRRYYVAMPYLLVVRISGEDYRRPSRTHECGERHRPFFLGCKEGRGGTRGPCSEVRTAERAQNGRKGAAGITEAIGTACSEKKEGEG